MAHGTGAAAERCLTKEQVRKVLDLTTDRAVYLLAQQGRIDPVAMREEGQRPVTMYTESSVRAYREARDSRYNGTTALVPVAHPRQAPPEAEDEGEIDTLSIQPWQFMTIAEAARHLRLDQVLVRDAIEAGRLAYVRRRSGGQMVKRSDVEALPAWERIERRPRR